MFIMEQSEMEMEDLVKEEDLSCEKHHEPMQEPMENMVHFETSTEKLNEEQYEIKVEILANAIDNESSGETLNEEEREMRTTNIMYMYTETSSDDDVLFCAECKVEHHGDCPEHGPLIVVQNMKVEENDPDRALHSLPSNLLVKESCIDGAGLGVFTDTEISPGTTYGPYEGIEIRDPELATCSGYSWQICKNGVPSHYIDATDTARSNWMRYVNCALSDSDQNLVAFQYQGNIYFRCIKPILPKSELFVWYGDDCARNLGIIKDSNNLLQVDVIMEKDTHRKRHTEKKPPTYGKLFSRKSDYIYNFKNHKRKRRRIKNNTRKKQNLTTICDNTFYPRCTREHNYSQIEESKEAERTPNKSKEPGNTISGMPPSTKDTWEYSVFKCYICSTCHKPFYYKSQLKAHMRKCSWDKPFKTAECTEAYLHMAVGLKHPREKCTPKADETFNNRFPREHNYSKNKEIEDQRQQKIKETCTCTVCDKTFRSKISLRYHLRMQACDKPYKCTVCYEAFRDQLALEGHKRTHTGEKRYLCHFCGNAYQNSSALKIHTRMHTGEKPFKCTICDRPFGHRSNLSEHVRIHTGEKPYVCHYCKKGFHSRSNFTKHERSHTGEKPYVCPYCSKAFGQTYSLICHIGIHKNPQADNLTSVITVASQ